MPLRLSSPLVRLAVRLFALAFACLAFAPPAAADPADIDAAARGVVRVVVIGRDGDLIFPISHGTGFAVAPETIVTNAHVVAEAIEDPRLSLGIVPSDGGDAVFARLVAVSQRNDLALIETTSPMRLPQLTISGNPDADAGMVTAVGYPQNVDRAQGLSMEDIFRAQPPVKSQGFLSGRRPSREFDTLLHTAPIARGSSGGPLLDGCGRIIGVNSFGTAGTGTDAEFFFAVSTRELLPFLRANEVSPQINALPCRSLAELEQGERLREEQRRARMAAEAAKDERTLARKRDETRRQIEFSVLAERENLMALTFLLLVLSMAAGGLAWRAHDAHQDEQADDPDVPERRFAIATLVAGGIALVALAAAVGAWLSRPTFATIEGRLEEALRADMEQADRGPIADQSRGGTLACTLDQARSRVTGAADPEVSLDWDGQGCINGRTQYAFSAGAWTRVFVPANEAAVSVSSFEPMTGEFVTERYLLSRGSMEQARTARASFGAPQCGAGRASASGEFAIRQAEFIAQLPARPNERLVYNCTSG